MATKKTPRRSAATKTASKVTKKKTTKKKAPATKKTAKKAAKKPASKKRATKRSAGGKSPTGNDAIRVEREIGGRTLVLETGRMAKLADGAIVARYGDTTVLATAQSGGENPNVDFFPLTVDYREKAAAGGKFPGGFFKREGRPTTREILTCRIIDRSIRPLFVDGFKHETQVLSQVLSTDRENESDTLAAIASFAAIAISSIPNTKTLGMCRIGLIDDELVINPTWSQLQSEENQLNLTVSAHDDAIVMVEAGAKQVAESVMLEALELGHEVAREIAAMIDELVAICGREKIEVTPPERDEKLVAAITKKFAKKMGDAATSGGRKFERGAAIKEVRNEIVEAFPPPKNATDDEAAKHEKFVKSVAGDLCKQGERDSILKGKRADGRRTDEIRPLDISVDVLPRVHGSALFTRGETQALCTATLGTADDRQFMDGIYPEERKNFLLHYAFPPFSVGEVRRFLAPGRREIGHGALAERSIEPVLPNPKEFPYSLRITSEILESNGSSSMASVCGGTLALMDAGVPLQQPVAGIAMGLVVEGKKIAILSDILGSEDHCGDMDFKVSGTGKGITALQMDIKCEGLARRTLEDALDQAREGRLYLLREMLEVIRQPRKEISPNAPRLESLMVPVDRIGAVIGPGGRNIRGMQEDYDVRITIEDDGRVEVAGLEAAKVNDCLERIRLMTADIEIGTVYKGKVSGIKEFGAFVELVPGQEGLCHVSELADGFIRSVTDVVQIGDEIEVKVIEIDDFGKIKLSRRALLVGEEGGGREGGDDAPRARGGREGRRPRRDDDEDRPRGRRPRRDDEDEDRPRGRRPRREEEDEDRPRGRRPRRDSEDEDRPRSRRPRREEEDEDRPRGRRPRRDSEDEDRPRSRRPRRDEEDEDRPRGRRPRRDDEDEDRPRGRRPRRDDEDEDRPRGRRPRRDSEDEERPRSRRPRRDEEDEDRPRGRRPRRDDEDEDRPRSRRPRRENGDDEDRPRGRRPRRDDEDEDRPRSRRPRRDDDEEDRPRGRRPRRDDNGEAEFSADDDRPRRGRRRR